MAELELINRPELNPEERKIYECAKIGYEKALKYYYTPSLPDPNLIFDYTKEKGFFIDQYTWQITLNLANIPPLVIKEDLINYFFVMSLHEISHYLYIPYDSYTNFKLIAAAIEGGVGRNMAPTVVNIFADLIIDKKIHDSFPSLIEWETKRDIELILSRISPIQISPLWIVLIRSYELLWDVTLVDWKIFTNPENSKLNLPGSKRKKRSGIPSFLQPNIDPILRDAKRIVDIIKRDMFNELTWETKVKKISKILKNILKNSGQNSFFGLSLGEGTQGDRQQGGGGSKGNPLNGSSGHNKNRNRGKNAGGNSGSRQRNNADQNTGAGGRGAGGASSSSQIPDDVRFTFGDLSELKDPEFIKEMGKDKGNTFSEEDFRERIRQLAEDFAEQMGFKSFSDTLAVYGELDQTERLRLWYRGLSKNLLKIEITVPKPGASLPIYPTVWRLGDPLEDLDILQTLLASPIIIPNITTRKWKKKEGKEYVQEKSFPDLMIVLDSSGSMDWNFNSNKISGPYHISLLASFAAIHYAKNKNIKFAAINFSGSCRIQDWTYDYRKIEWLLLQYQGDGTVMPIKNIERLAKKAENPSLIMIISDWELSNWDSTAEIIVKLLNMKHKFIGFFIGGNESILKSKPFADLITQGAKFYCIKRIKDLIGLVIKEIKENY